MKERPKNFNKSGEGQLEINFEEEKKTEPEPVNPPRDLEKMVDDLIESSEERKKKAAIRAKEEERRKELKREEEERKKEKYNNELYKRD